MLLSETTQKVSLFFYIRKISDLAINDTAVIRSSYIQKEALGISGTIIIVFSNKLILPPSFSVAFIAFAFALLDVNLNCIDYGGSIQL